MVSPLRTQVPPLCAEVPPRVTTILFVDSHDAERQYWVERLKVCSSEYRILETQSIESGLNLYETQSIDCVVLELDLHGSSGFSLLVRLVPRVYKPQVAVVVLTRLTLLPLCELARRNGAEVVLLKHRASGDDLDRAIRKAIAIVGPKKQRAM